MYNSDRKYRSFFENSSDAMLIIENGKFVDCNTATIEMLGYNSKEEVINKPPFELSPEIQPDGRKSSEKASEMIQEAIRNGHHRFEWDHRKKDGSVFPVEVSLTAIKNNGDIHIHTVWRDISSRKRAEQQLRESEEHFRYSFETNPDPVIIARLDDGAIIDVNDAFVEETGISRIEAVGHNSEQLGLWQERSLRESFRGRLMEKGEVTNFEAEFKVQDGQVKTGLLSARIIKRSGTPSMLLVIRDITREKKAERALAEMDQLKSNFITTAAHELRTPLASIIGFAELLLNSHEEFHIGEDKRRLFLQEIFDRGESLERMIDDFLDVSRIENGLPLPLDKNETDLVSLLEKTVELIQLREQDFLFKLNLPHHPARPMIVIDLHRINQVLDNLLSNAVKYSPAGSTITICGECCQEGWYVSVEDQGIGMSEQEISRIFDRFYRAESSATSVKGLGLGMSIVQYIVEAHGGHIDTESTVGNGSKFTFLLPHQIREKA